jgi:hypothetical protein
VAAEAVVVVAALVVWVLVLVWVPVSLYVEGDLRLLRKCVVVLVRVVEVSRADAQVSLYFMQTK